MRDQLPGLEYELKVRRHERAPAFQGTKFRWLVEGMLNFDTSESACVVGLRQTKTTGSDSRATAVTSLQVMSSLREQETPSLREQKRPHFVPALQNSLQKYQCRSTHAVSASLATCRSTHAVSASLATRRSTHAVSASSQRQAPNR